MTIRAGRWDMTLNGRHGMPLLPIAVAATETTAQIGL